MIQAQHRMAGTALVLALLGGNSAVGAEHTFDVLTRPALSTPKARHVAALAIGSAGPRLVTVGERGIVLLSDDAGMAWRQAQVPASVSLTAVQFVDGSHGWATGHLGVVLHSDDGGASWQPQLDGITAAKLAVQQAADASAAQQLVDDGPDKPFLDLWFEDADDGFVVGAFGLAFRTSDGGKSWIDWQSHLPNPRGLHLYSIKANASGLFVAGEQGLLLRSDDGGATFTPLASPYKGSWFGLVAAKDGSVIAFGLRGNVYRSIDRGESWQALAGGSEAAISAGCQRDDGSLVLVSQGGDVLLANAPAGPLHAVPTRGDAPLTGVVCAGRDVIASSLRGPQVLSIAASSSR